MPSAARCLSRSFALTKSLLFAGVSRTAPAFRATAAAAFRPHLEFGNAGVDIRCVSVRVSKEDGVGDTLIRSLELQGENTSAALKGKSFRVDCYEKSLVFLHEPPSLVRPAQIRDNCPCPKCRDPHSGQKSFLTTEIPVDIGFKDMRLTNDGLEVEFNNDIERLAQAGHGATLIPWQALAKWGGVSHMEDERFWGGKTLASLRHTTGVEFWDGDVLTNQIRKIDYEDFMRRGQPFWDVITDILRLGIVYLKNVPREEDSVEKITTAIANVKETFYGRTFDVRAKPDAENVAYTSGDLGLHQDLLYLESPPQVQILHCMDNSCAGGDSTFSDGERVARLLLLLAANTPLEELVQVEVPYGYGKNGYYYFQARPIIEINDKMAVSVVPNWSPPFQATWDWTASRPLQRWLLGARLFHELINDPGAVYKNKMQPGECVLFDNRRIMHGRTAFDTSGGSRWLRGAYISQEDFISRAAYLPEEMTRGSAQWHPKTAATALRKTEWFEDVKKRVEAYGLNYESEAA